MQQSFWEQLSKSKSEKFFQEIHNRFQDAQTEIKNSPMGLVVTQEVSVRAREREREREIHSFLSLLRLVQVQTL